MSKTVEQSRGHLRVAETRGSRLHNEAGSSEAMGTRADGSRAARREVDGTSRSPRDRRRDEAGPVATERRVTGRAPGQTAVSRGGRTARGRAAGAKRTRPQKAAQRRVENELLLVVEARIELDHCNPKSLLVTLIGAGILWLSWNGFNGGDPYFANADAGAAVLNTNTATAVALLVWTLIDKMAYGKPSVLGAVNGMIAGLVAITPGAGYIDGFGAIIIGIVAGFISWMAMNWLQKTSFMMRVDDTLSVFSTHGVAA